MGTLIVKEQRKIWRPKGHRQIKKLERMLGENMSLKLNGEFKTKGAVHTTKCSWVINQQNSEEKLPK